ncbi:GpE family phage tail protein [Candidatus Schmidhempelia bombi str. Bimp]|uniref:GpE family phage tail protein n=1 Tax=Candidatus Schmidhempelia bombi str. Bimp TaxID=1387197 RepID=A0AB94IC54_9GAMM|nr:GpE family phage tail protein [Candidatus Schmidhempelia bombi]TEA26990.1 GpE family phage tail protein [Candidatus Schmidhempelia bombi str. Bimp]
MPDRVENAQADIATIFHWSLDALDKLTISELMHWREQARIRSGATDE